MSQETRRRGSGIQDPFKRPLAESVSDLRGICTLCPGCGAGRFLGTDLALIGRSLALAGSSLFAELGLNDLAQGTRREFADVVPNGMLHDEVEQRPCIVVLRFESRSTRTAYPRSREARPTPAPEGNSAIRRNTAFKVGDIWINLNGICYYHFYEKRILQNEPREKESSIFS